MNVGGKYLICRGYDTEAFKTIQDFQGRAESGRCESWPESMKGSASLQQQSDQNSLINPPLDQTDSHTVTRNQYRGGVKRSCADQNILWHPSVLE